MCFKGLVQGLIEGLVQMLSQTAKPGILDAEPESLTSVTSWRCRGSAVSLTHSLSLPLCQILALEKKRDSAETVADKDAVQVQIDKVCVCERGGGEGDKGLRFTEKYLGFRVQG